MTTHTTTIELEDGTTINVRVQLCGKPRKTLPPQPIETTGYTVDDDATVIRPSQFARAS